MKYILLNIDNTTISYRNPKIYDNEVYRFMVIFLKFREVDLFTFFGRDHALRPILVIDFGRIIKSEEFYEELKEKNMNFFIKF